MGPHMTKTQFSFFKAFSICGMICADMIKSAHFRGGWFENNRDGSWSEYTSDGRLRYRFKEVSRGDLAVKLRHEGMNVTLVIDTVRRVITGEWPGHPRSDIYAITHFGNFPPAPAPVPPVPQPDPPAPDPVPPLPHPPAPADIAPADLVLVQHRSGRFKKDGRGRWTEFAPSGAIFSFDSLGYNDRSLFLLDRSRNVFLEIDTRGRAINIPERGRLRRLYTISGMSDHILAPPPQPPQPPIPQPPRPEPGPDGKLTAFERVQCLTQGGFVERAGLLGAERCTRPYSDGGMICSDNSQCQGNCIAPPNSAGELVVSGTCQKNDNTFGCMSFVENGRATPALCVD